MIRSLALSLVLITASGPALALSCMRPDAVRMFEYARDSANTYYVIKGRVTPLGSFLLPEATNGKDGSADTAVQISGLGLSAQGFSIQVDVSATVRLKCLSVWCASPPTDEELLMIVEIADEDLVLEIGPCGGTALASDKDAEDRLLQCHLAGECEAATF